MDSPSTTGAPTPATSTTSGPTPKLPLKIRRSIRERYDPDAPALQTQARSLLAMPDFNFIPNFEHNHALLAAFDASLDRSDGEDNGRLSEYWQDQLGQMTLEYFQGFVDRLRSEGFKGDDMQQEGFQDAVTKRAVEVRIVEEVDALACDCAIVDGLLVIRTTVEKWGLGTSVCCEGLVGLL